MYNNLNFNILIHFKMNKHFHNNLEIISNLISKIFFSNLKVGRSTAFCFKERKQSSFIKFNGNSFFFNRYEGKLLDYNVDEFKERNIS